MTIEKRTSVTKNLRTIMNGRWIPVIEAGDVLGVHPDTLAGWCKDGAVMQQFHADHVTEAMQTPEWKLLLAKFDLPAGKKPRTVRSIGQRNRLLSGKEMGCDKPKQRTNKAATGKSSDPFAKYNSAEREYLLRQVAHKVDLDELILQGYRKGRIA